MYVNAHTHSAENVEGVSVYNCSRDECSFDQYFSLGLHPWDADRIGIDVMIDRLNFSITNAKFVAVGEIGLDRVCDVAWGTQEKIFEAQLSWAQKNNKPVILHCVRAYYDIISILKKHRITIPIIFHDYRGNSVVTSALNKYACFYSLGMKALKQNKAVSSIPLEKLFLETDNSGDTIEGVYEMATSVLHVERTYLQNSIYQRFTSVFL